MAKLSKSQLQLLSDVVAVLIDVANNNTWDDFASILNKIKAPRNILSEYEKLTLASKEEEETINEVDEDDEEDSECSVYDDTDGDDD